MEALEKMSSAKRLDWEKAMNYWELTESPHQPNLLAKKRELNLTQQQADESSRHPASVLSIDGELSELFPNARSWSVLQWNTLTSLAGESEQREFLEKTFSRQKKFKLESKNVLYLVVKAPQERWLPSLLAISKENFLSSEKIAKILAKNQLKYEILELSPFEKIDEQAHELYQRIADHYGIQEVIVVTTQISSAIFYHAVDLHPELTVAKNIKTWINWQGLLFGFSPKISAKNWNKQQQKLYSTIDHRQWLDLMRISVDSLQKNLDLKTDYPIVNIVDSDAPSDFNLRESIVPEGATYFYSASINPDFPEFILPVR